MADEKLLEQQLNGEFGAAGAQDARVELDEEFEPDAGALVKVQIGPAYWHLLPGALLQLLGGLPQCSLPPDRL